MEPGPPSLSRVFHKAWCSPDSRLRLRLRPGRRVRCSAIALRTPYGSLGGGGSSYSPSFPQSRVQRTRVLVMFVQWLRLEGGRGDMSPGEPPPAGRSGAERSLCRAACETLRDSIPSPVPPSARQPDAPHPQSSPLCPWCSRGPSARPLPTGGSSKEAICPPAHATNPTSPLRGRQLPRGWLFPPVFSDPDACCLLNWRHRKRSPRS